MIHAVDDHTVEHSCDICGAVCFLHSTKAELLQPGGEALPIEGRVAISVRPFAVVVSHTKDGRAPVVCATPCGELGPEWVSAIKKPGQGN